MGLSEQRTITCTLKNDHSQSNNDTVVNIVFAFSTYTPHNLYFTVCANMHANISQVMASLHMS